MASTSIFRGFRAHRPLWIILAIFFVVGVRLLTIEHMALPDEDDERISHLPAIMGFYAQFPAVDLRDYTSATGPLYHLIITAAAVVGGTHLYYLRFVGFLLSIVALVAAYFLIRRRAEGPRAYLFVALIAASPYYVGSAIRISTDNTAFAFAFLALLAMDRLLEGKSGKLAATVFMSAATLTRQPYLWLVGSYVITTFARIRFASIGTWVKEAALPVLVPVAALASLVVLWGGLNPPRFQGHLRDPINLDALTFMLAVLAGLAIFFGAWMLELVRALPARARIFWIGLPSALGALLLVLHPVSGSMDRALLRGGPLWRIAERAPELGGTAAVFWVLTPLGSATLALLVRKWVIERDWVMASALPLWFLSQLPNVSTFQKYYEPFMLLALGCATRGLRANRWYHWVGPVLLLLALIGMDVPRFQPSAGVPVGP